MSKKFDNFRFDGFKTLRETNQYRLMERFSEDENKIIVKVAASHLLRTKFGYALILDDKHVIFVKEWQVDQNYYGNEVLLDRNYWQVKEWGDFSNDFSENEENYNFETWLAVAKSQQEFEDEEGNRNIARWKK